MMPGEVVNGDDAVVLEKIKALYDSYEILDKEKDDQERRSNAYLRILEAVHGSPQEKKLAAQFIPRFFKHFLEMGERPIEAMLDLCEDEDVIIRKQAVKALPNLCRDAPDNVFKIADVLAQLSQTDDQAELGVVYNSLVSIVTIDPKETFRGIFGQVQQNDQEIIRERCLKFMTAKMRVFSDGGYLTKEVEDIVFDEAKKCMADLNADEFLRMMAILAQTKTAQTVSGQQAMVDFVAEKMEIDTPLTVLDAENMDRLLRCLREALPYFSSPVNSDKYVHYLISLVFPYLDSMTPEVAHLKLELFKVFAELTLHASTDYATKFPKDLETIYHYVVSLLALPPSYDEAQAEGNGEAAKEEGDAPNEQGEQKKNDTEEPNLGLSQIECMLYSFHRLVQHAPDFFAKKEQNEEGEKVLENEISDRLVDLRKRLTYLSRRTQGYVKALREHLANKTPDDLKREENKVRVIALRTTSNVTALTKDFFHNPPSFKVNLALSWKPVSHNRPEQTRDRALKRKPISFDEEGKHTGRPLYEPPGGKFSRALDKYPGPPARGGRGSPRGRFARNRRGGGGYARYNRT